MRGARWLRVRRVIDVPVVLVAAPLLIPLALVAMFAVIVEDRGSPIVRLERVGRNGSLLIVAKIRSMTIGNGASITSAGDRRITSVGRRLRSYRLDEIPQVWHVITGHMALIGPRPEDPRFVDLANPLWIAALQARPAVAGLTQIVASTWEDRELIGDQATVKYRNIAVPAKVAIDAWYAENASPRVDLVVVRSLFDMFVRGAEWTPAHDLIRREIPAGAVLLSVE